MGKNITLFLCLSLTPKKEKCDLVLHLCPKPHNVKCVLSARSKQNVSDYTAFLVQVDSLSRPCRPTDASRALHKTMSMVLCHAWHPGPLSMHGADSLGPITGPEPGAQAQGSKSSIAMDMKGFLVLQCRDEPSL